MNFIPNPGTLDFSRLMPGQSSIAISTLAVGNSSLDVIGISVSPGIGTVFTEDNLLFSVDNGANFVSADELPVIFISENSSFELYLKLNIPVGTFAQEFSGTIIYPVVEGF
ncbi:MAG: hypothetical protein KJ718_05150 [Nanoarchaeota archaeon]|nr:hypothetical protein [Nanoarchaeota archaeon]MBU1051913.1 hypothetical protein [Nanoarchaeota archaeon]MBU1988956.1 hypothetical protein [Nanoarchaeota archaeon]